MKGFRPLPRAWVAIRGRHLRWSRRALGLVGAPMVRSAPGVWGRPLELALTPHGPEHRRLVCVGSTDRPSRPLTSLRLTVQSVLCLGVCHPYSDGGYDRT